MQLEAVGYRLLLTRTVWVAFFHIRHFLSCLVVEKVCK